MKMHLDVPQRNASGRTIRLSLLIVFVLSMMVGPRAVAQVDPPPVITSYSPLSGAVGSPITIEGVNLRQTTAVQFGTINAEFSVFDTHQVVAIVPTGATNAPITIVTLGGSAESATSFVVTQAKPPVIHAVVPNSGPAGTEVIVNGENLEDATDVRFNGVPALFRVGFSGTNLVATIPNSATSGPVSVTTPLGTFTTTVAFTITTTPAPEITSFAPTSGPSGTRVAITGNNFTGVTSVQFNGVPVEFSLFGNTITAFVPIGAVSGPITVVALGGTGSSSTPFVVTAPGAPIIRTISPNIGRPGTSITITGQNLESATAVNFNGVPASFSFFGSAILATVPTGSSTGPVTVVTPNGTVSGDLPFTVLDPLAPEITSFTPANGSVGTVVTLVGTNFANATEVRFGGASAQFTVVSNGEIRATVPSGATTSGIVISAPAGTAVSSEIFHVPAQVLSFEPAHGPVGTTVTIRGANFNDTFAVLFSGASATFIVISPAEIRATVPEGAASGAITVATPAGFANSQTSFLLPPAVTSFEPASALPGTEVSIVGENLLGATSVRFAGAEAVFTPVSITRLIATVPPTAVNGPVTVVSPAGTTTSSVIFYVGLFSDLAVSLDTFPDTVVAGDLLRYTITVTNRGPLEAANVVLTERLPAGTELIFPPSGGDCSTVNNVITCNLGTLNPGTEAAIRITVSILAGPYLTNEVSVVSTDADPDLANNRDSTVTALEGAPPLPGEVTLSGVLGPNGLTLSWPVTADGYVLETAATLTSAWAPVLNAPATVDGKKTVILNTSSGSGFYRLRKP